ncbi:GNAT family N-acetyltransferase [Endozoicomonas sp. SM1973]|uniref:GNAT family N-acetyltransferase n=1 Tax=Spartinivicinus marinus TaxID=2994442 RepID=A0A853I1C0_9GAMM|nr:GNAT family N-acetyltransferase [Spartinivicinus marinus]MCX4029151.1 GNAT family N-acetyltransferase [Spartinivicinus marinus]NYZ67770.1 GNAT family N-acetyltransferase [Spartinivicinus marinus]
MEIINYIKSYDDLYSLFKEVKLGSRNKDEIKKAFESSKYISAIYKKGKIIGVGRAFGDEIDCAVICDLAVSLNHQSKGVGSKILQSLVKQVNHHLRIILYAEPGKSDFYEKNNFHTMKTAMMTSSKLPLELGRQIGFIE